MRDSYLSSLTIFLLNIHKKKYYQKKRREKKVIIYQLKELSFLIGIFIKILSKKSFSIDNLNTWICDKKIFGYGHAVRMSNLMNG